jgi:hypothetical protein
VCRREKALYADDQAAGEEEYDLCTNRATKFDHGGEEVERRQKM